MTGIEFRRRFAFLYLQARFSSSPSSNLRQEIRSPFDASEVPLSPTQLVAGTWPLISITTTSIKSTALPRTTLGPLHLGDADTSSTPLQKENNSPDMLYNLYATCKVTRCHMHHIRHGLSALHAQLQSSQATASNAVQDPEVITE